ncbi:hypothetical protein HDU91_004124 [Kappamyces sp. JEL0680]|nr:hypothetical protein HDU91_004124 [Kappamyces sp. JEL0680]
MLRLFRRLPVVGIQAPKPLAGTLRFYSSRKYTPDHEWLSIEGDIGTFGITDYAQKALGDVVYIEVPTVGDKVEKKESVKAASDIYSPVSGTIVKVNEALEGEPSLINSSPYGDGWIAQIKLENAEEEVPYLLTEEQYAKLVE